MHDMDITIDEFTELRCYIQNQLELSGQHIGSGELATALLDFASKFSIGAMLRFKNWMLDNGYGHDEILVSIVHDLNDRNDVCFLPRTDSY